MILEFDVGNTRTKWRVLSDVTSPKVVERGVFSSRSLSEDMSEISSLCLSEHVSRIRLASVANLAFTQRLISALESNFSVAVEQVFTASRLAGVTNSYSDPSKMGVDRWMTIVAAYKRAQGACCVIDCGTAIKVEMIASDGCHRGGYILPSVDMMVDSLLSNTAQIANGMTDVSHGDLSLGRNTTDAVVGGANYLVCALRDKLFAQVANEGGYPVYVTGGNATAFLAGADVAEICPDLVFEGLAIAAP